MIRACFRPVLTLALWAALAIVVTGCAAKEPTKPCDPPTMAEQSHFYTFNGGRTMAESRLIDIGSQGLHSWLEFEPALRHSLEYVEDKPESGVALRRNGLRVTWAQIKRSLTTMLELLPLLDRRPELLAKYFTWYSLDPRPLVTGYFTPIIEASLRPGGEYRFPIYRRPPELKQRERGQTGVPAVYRVEKGEVLPYHTRADVDLDKVLSGRGLEIAWAKSAFDVFELQLEGAGRLKLPDGSYRDLAYAAKNGHKFTSLSRILLNHGYLPKDKLGKRHLRAFFKRHPEKALDLMAENDSYVFFRFSDQGGLGAMGKPLHPMVTLATDPKLLPLGSMLLLQAEVPGPGGEGKQGVRGLTLAQDTGSLIKGSHVDYFIGMGEHAEDVASCTYTRGNLYLPLSREALKQ